MKKLFSVLIVLLMAMALIAPTISAQTVASTGCTTYATASGDATNASFSADFFEGEVIDITVNSADGATFDVSIGGELTTGAVDGDTIGYLVPADETVAVEITITNAGTGTYAITCTPADEVPDYPPGTLCHIPPGNPFAAHTITVGEPAIETHLGHGDTEGPCPPGVQTRTDFPSLSITLFVIYGTDSIELYDECTDECEEVLNIPIILIIDLDLVVISFGESEDGSEEDTDGGEFMQVDDPEDFGFVLDEVDLSGTYIVIYYLHPNPDDPTVGVFQINIYDNGTLIDDSILLFINTSGEIVLWADQSYWEEQAAG